MVLEMAQTNLTIEDCNTLELIRSVMVRFYRQLVNHIIRNSRLLHVTVNSYYTRQHVLYSNNGICIPERVLTWQNIESKDRLLTYIWLVLHFYEALLEIANDPNVDTQNSVCLRNLFYLMESFLNKQDSQMMNSVFLLFVSKIFPMLDVSHNSVLMKVLHHDDLFQLCGDVGLIECESGLEIMSGRQDRRQISMTGLRVVQLIRQVECEFVLGPNITELFIFESAAICSANYLLNSPRLYQKVFVDKTAVIVVLKGDANLFCRFLLTKLANVQGRHVISNIITDLDAPGINMSYTLKHGVQSPYCIWNQFQSIPFLNRLGPNPFDLIRQDMNVSELSPQEIVDYESRLNNARMVKHFDYTKELIENVALCLLYNRFVKGQFLTFDSAMVVYDRLLQTFTIDDLCRRFENSANTEEYFQHLWRFEEFWLTFYDQRGPHGHFWFDFTRFRDIGIPSLFVNRFIQIFMDDPTLNHHNLRAPILNSVSNETYICENDIDVQIVQLNLNDYLLVNVGEHTIEIHGMLTVEEFATLDLTDRFLKRYPNRFEVGSNPDIYRPIPDVFFGSAEKRASGLVCCAYAIDLVRHGRIFDRDPINILNFTDWFTDILQNQRIDELPHN